MDGLLLIDKPAGITSHDVVDAVRRIAKTRAVGHAGTLDPFATGLLILGINKATKWLTDLVGLDKTYEAGLLLGETSDTFDPEGAITPWPEAITTPPDQKKIEQALEAFRGTFEQRAPLYSAKKLKGKKLYELAREGKAEESMRPTKLVTIQELRIQSYIFPSLELFIHCTSGTYIRSLGDDIGRALNTGAYVKTLRRTSIGAYSIAQAHSLPELRSETLSQALLTRNLDKLA